MSTAGGVVLSAMPKSKRARVPIPSEPSTAASAVMMPTAPAVAGPAMPLAASPSHPVPGAAPWLQPLSVLGGHDA